MRRHLPPKELFIGKTIPSIPDYTITDYIASGNNGLLYRAFNEKIGNECAIKIVPIENVVPEDYLDEAKKANRLDNPSVVRYQDVVNHSEEDSHYVVFRCDYVKGYSLRDYIEKKALRDNVDIPFIKNFLGTMFGLLFELKQRGYHHGDLHAGNILVAKSDYDMSGQVTFRVTDFGVRQFTGQTAHTSDYLYVAETLHMLLNIVDYCDCSGPQRYVYDVLRNDFLGRHLIETDPTADPIAGDPREMNERLSRLEQQYRDEDDRHGAPRAMLTPFDFPSCEQIGNSHLLLQALYSERLLGLPEIRSRSNIVVTGPRGCGKTTVFKALSLDYLMATGGDAPESVNYIGIYYRCDDLYFAFPRYKETERLDAIDVPMHFLVVTLLAEALKQIETWTRRHDSLAADLEAIEEQMVAMLWDVLRIDPPDSPSANRLGTLIGRLTAKERRRAVNKWRRVHIVGEVIDGYVGPGELIEAFRVIRQHLSFLQRRPVYFFIDDYSHPKITMALQENLNRLLMHRGADVFFKLSTESPVSFARQDADGKKYVESREYEFLNLGLRYIITDVKHVSDFLHDLFRRRFCAVDNYPVGELEDLVGSIPRNENDIARKIRSNPRTPPQYAGCEAIAAMCSGDIHYIIRLVARMVEDNGGVNSLVAGIDAKPIIPVKNQNTSIRAAAGAFMESIRILPDKGPALAAIITAFGNVSRSYLLHMDSRNGIGNPPHQASRIEPHEPLQLSDDAQDILNELLRYSVFIEDPRGKSRRGHVVSRFYLRRYLIPHLRLTFSRRDSIPLNRSEVERLLCDPEKFRRSMTLKSSDDAARRQTEIDQGLLFEETDDST